MPLYYQCNAFYLQHFAGNCIVSTVHTEHLLVQKMVSSSCHYELGRVSPAE